MYAHLPSNAGQHAEALAVIARARTLDPLSGLINAMEGQILLHAGRTDEAIARLRDAIELEPRSRVAHLYAASALIEKGMFGEAAAEAGRKKMRIPWGVYSQSILIRVPPRNRAFDDGTDFSTAIHNNPALSQDIPVTLDDFRHSGAIRTDLVGVPSPSLDPECVFRSASRFLQFGGG